MKALNSERFRCMVVRAVSIFTFCVVGQARAENAIYLDCPVRIPSEQSDSFAVRVSLTNDVPLNAFSVGFKYHSDDIQASSVQNEPELQLPTAPGIFFVRLYPESNLVAVGWLNYNEYYPLPIHNSPTHVFTIWFQNTGSFSGACIDIDSSYTPSAGYWHYIYQLHQKELFPAYFDCDTCDLIGSLCVCGDADISGRIDVTDVVFMVNYIFGSGPGPSIQSLCDVDCSNRIDVTDCVYLINFIFAAGAVPCAACAK